MNLNITTLSLSYILFFSLNLFFCVTYASSNTSLVPFAPMGDLKTEDSIASPLVHGCPRSCTTLGSDPANWTQIHDLNTLDRCKEPTLFAFNIHSELHVDTPKVSCSLLDEYPQRVLTSAKKDYHARSMSVTIAACCQGWRRAKGSSARYTLSCIATRRQRYIRPFDAAQ